MNRTMMNMMIMNMKMIDMIMMNMTINFHIMSRLIGIMIMYIVRLMRIHPEYCECDYENRYLLCTIWFSFPSKTSVSWYPFRIPTLSPLKGSQLARSEPPIEATVLCIKTSNLVDFPLA